MFFFFSLDLLDWLKMFEEHGQRRAPYLMGHVYILSGIFPIGWVSKVPPWGQHVVPTAWENAEIGCRGVDARKHVTSDDFETLILEHACGVFEWPFQVPKLEVLYHIKPYKAIGIGGISPYIGLANRPFIWQVPPIQVFRTRTWFNFFRFQPANDWNDRIE